MNNKPTTKEEYFALLDAMLVEGESTDIKLLEVVQITQQGKWK
jgi:hypothetical protein